MADHEAPAQACGFNAMRRLTKADRETIRATITLEKRQEYFAASVCPITAEVEERMEQVGRCGVANRSLRPSRAPWSDAGLYCA
jgi:hypothetical protein